MKNKNIELHFNIMKVFKYLVFTFAFFAFQLFISGYRINAYSQIKCDLSEARTHLCYSRGFDGSYATKWKEDEAYMEYTFSDDKGGLLFNLTRNSIVKLNIYVCDKGEECYYSPSKLPNNVITTTVGNYWGPLGVEIQKDGTIIEHGNEYKWYGKINYIDVTNRINFYDQFIKNTNYEKNGFRLYITARPNGDSTDYFFYLDTDFYTKPTITITDDNPSSYKKKHVLTVKSNSVNKIQKKEYCWSKSLNSSSCGSWNTLSGTTIEKSDGTGIYYLHVKAIDKLGNENVKTAEVKMDNTEPSITYTPPSESITDWAKSHTFTGVTATDGHSGVGTEYYCWSTSSSECDGAWQTFTNGTIKGSEPSGTYHLFVKAKDEAGNESKAIIIKSKEISETIQKTVTYTKEYSNTAQKNSLIRQGYICFEGFGINKGSCRKNVTKNETKVIQPSENVLFRFDNEAPKVNEIKVGNSDIRLSSDKWTNETEFTIRITDEHSGLVSAKLNWKGLASDDTEEELCINMLNDDNSCDKQNIDSTNDKLVSFNWMQYKKTISNGLYIKIILIDKAGNSYVEERILYIDNVAPTVSVSTAIELSGEGREVTESEGMPILNTADRINYTLTIVDYNLMALNDPEINTMYFKIDPSRENASIKFTFKKFDYIYTYNSTKGENRLRGKILVNYYDMTAKDVVSNNVSAIKYTYPLIPMVYIYSFGDMLFVSDSMPKAISSSQLINFENILKIDSNVCKIENKLLVGITSQLGTTPQSLMINFSVSCNNTIEIIGGFDSKSNVVINVSDKLRNETIITQDMYRGKHIFSFDNNGVTLKDEDNAIKGTVTPNGFFPAVSNSTQANLVTYEVEEVALVDIEVKEEEATIVVKDEEVKDIEVSVDEEDTSFIYHSDSDYCMLYVQVNYVEELKKSLLTNKSKKQLDI